MKQKLRMILAAALVTAVSVNMAGCGSSAQNESSAQSSSATQSTSESTEQSGNSEASQVDTMKLTLTDGTVEEFKGDELQKLAYSNNAAVQKYLGAAIEMTAKVKKVTAHDYGIGYGAGDIELSNMTKVKYKSKNLDFVSTLKEGDTLKVTGILAYFYTGPEYPTVVEYEKPTEINGTTIEDTTITMEKVEG